MAEPGHEGGFHQGEPSPEEAFAGLRRYNVVLTDANPETPASVLKGIRAVLESLADEPVELAAAEALWHKFNDGERPTLLGYAESQPLAKAAADEGLRASKGNVRIGYGLTPGELRAVAREWAAETAKNDAPVTEPPGPERMDPETLLPLTGDVPAEDWTPSLAAARTALVLAATCDGNAQAMIATARMLRHATRDEVYEDVVRLLLASFPIAAP